MTTIQFQLILIQSELLKCMFFAVIKTIARSPGYRLVKPLFAASRLAWFLQEASPIKRQQAKEGVTLLAVCHFNQAALCHSNHCAINPNQAQLTS